MYSKAGARQPLATLHAKKCSLISAQDDWTALWRAWLGSPWTREPHSVRNITHNTERKSTTQADDCSVHLGASEISFYTTATNCLLLLHFGKEGRLQREREHAKHHPPMLCPSPVVKPVRGYAPLWTWPSLGLNGNYTTVHNQLDFSSFHNTFTSFALTRNLSLSPTKHSQSSIQLSTILGSKKGLERGATGKHAHSTNTVLEQQKKKKKKIIQNTLLSNIWCPQGRRWGNRTP